MLTIVAAISFYFVVSISLVFLNKALLGDMGRSFPLFVTWWQFVVSWGCIWASGELGRVFPKLYFFPRLQFDLAVAWKVLPVTSMFVVRAPACAPLETLTNEQRAW